MISKYNELLVVLLSTLILSGWHLGGLTWLFEWTSISFYEAGQPDIGEKTKESILHVIQIAEFVMMSLSFVISPLAIYFPLKNDQLTWPIRLLAASENLSKFIFALYYVTYGFCNLPVNGDRSTRCSDNLYSVLNSIYFNEFLPYYIWGHTAQYSQMMISLSRFFAISFNGAYFRYTLRWPIVQLVLPYVYRIGFEQLKWPFPDSYFTFEPYFLFIPFFLMISLDSMTQYKFGKLKRKGKTTRCETLLMFQMITNSLIALIYTIVFYSAQSGLNVFFGVNVGILFLEILNFIQFSMFNVLTVFISIYCFRKAKEQKERKGSARQTIVISSAPPSSRHRD
ncbi:unnamed protein product, partial [Mesorhabditis belari]|uniref:Uncharacterized protein n=1 Tax=Mesorhabditis belari TaxID=2138241 RepID=A0AAF3EI62_9BILA